MSSIFKGFYREIFNFQETLTSHPEILGKVYK